MTVNFLDHIKTIEDHRVMGMVTYPLDGVLLTTLVGLVVGQRAVDTKINEITFIPENFQPGGPSKRGSSSRKRLQQRPFTPRRGRYDW